MNINRYDYLPYYRVAREAAQLESESGKKSGKRWVWILFKKLYCPKCRCSCGELQNCHGGWSKADIVKKYAHLSISHLHSIADNSRSGTKLTQKSIQ